MPISTLLAAASGAANSADSVLLTGAIATLTATGQGTVWIQPKTVSGYGPGESIGGAGVRTVQVQGPMTFRALRQADSSAGLDVETA